VRWRIVAAEYRSAVVLATREMRNLKKKITLQVRDALCVTVTVFAKRQSVTSQFCGFRNLLFVAPSNILLSGDRVVLNDAGACNSS